MKKNMIISIKGTQSQGGEHDKIELITNGTLESSQGKYYIRYDESDEEGYAECTVELEVDDDCVIMKRSGQVNTIMMFQNGEKHICHYDTGYGIMNMGIATKTIRNNIEKDGGRLLIKYAIDIDNAHVGNNTFEITLREAGGYNGKLNTIS